MLKLALSIANGLAHLHMEIVGTQGTWMLGLWLILCHCTVIKSILEYLCSSHSQSLGKKATIHQLTIMLSTFKNDLFPGHNHLLTSGADDPSLAGARVIIKVKGH